LQIGIDEARQIDEQTVQRRIDSIPVTPFVTRLTKAEQDHTVDRQLLCAHYNSADPVKADFFISRPGSVLGGRCAVLAANREMNPHISMQPGTNGLMLDGSIATTEVLNRSASPYAKREDEDDSVDGSKIESNSVADTNYKLGDLEDKKIEGFGYKLVFACIAPCHWRYLGRYEQYPLSNSLPWSGVSSLKP